MLQKRSLKQHKIQTSVLKTKLITPVPKGNIIIRPRLLSLIEKNLAKKLILIIADAGYGKTTLLSQLLRKKCLNNIYYTLTREDNSFVVFLSHVLMGFEQLNSDFVQRTKTLIHHGTELEANYKIVMGTLINELFESCPEDIYIILDDYHNLLENTLIHRALDYFLEHMPASVHMILASRVIPPLTSISRWRSKQQLFELKRNDLKFTPEEVKLLSTDIYHTQLPGQELKQVSQHTEGWITGIQLVLQAAGKHRITVKDTINSYLEAQQPLFDYFAHEVLSREAEHVQEFLMKSALLSIVTPDVCEKILKIRNSKTVLRKLVQRHLFLSEVGKDKYVYHHLFRKFLLAKLEPSALKKRLHQKVAVYYYKNRQYELSIQHYIQAERYEKAAKTILRSIEEDIAGKTYSRLDRFSLKNYLAQIPSNVTEKLPRLLLFMGVLFRDSGNLNKAQNLFIKAALNARLQKDPTTHLRSLLEQALLLWRKGLPDQALIILRKALRAYTTSQPRIKAHILNTFGLVWQESGNLSKARIYLLKAKRAAGKAGSSYDTIVLESNLATLLMQQGEMRRAFNTYVPLIQRLLGTYYFKVGVLYANAARSALDCGKIDWAESCLDDGLRLCKGYEDPISHASLNHVLGLLYIHKTRWDIAQYFLERAQTQYARTGWVRMEFNTLRSMSELYRYKRNYEKSAQYIEKAHQCLVKILGEVKGILGSFLLADQALLALDQGKLTEAIETINICLKTARKFDWRMAEFYFHFIKGTAGLEMKRRSQATRSLESVVRLAKLKGYDGVLSNELLHRPRLTAFLKKFSRHYSYINNLTKTKKLQKLNLTVKFCGGLQIIDEQCNTIDLKWPTEKTRSLCAFLVTHRSASVHREQLLNKLWPNLPKKKAQENLRTTSYRLRQTLIKALSDRLPIDEIITHKRGPHRLFSNIEIQTDVDEFFLLLKNTERAESDREKAKLMKWALDVVQYQYLPEIYDAWTDEPRRELQEHKLSILLWLIHYCIRTENHRHCVKYCDAYLALEPYSEEITRICIQSLLRLEQVTAAKARFTSLKKALRKGLRRSPSKETQDVYNTILTKSSRPS